MRLQFCPKAALEALLGTDSLYFSGSVGQLAPYVDNNVSIPSEQTEGCNIESVLKGDVLNKVVSFEKEMLLTSEELEGELENGTAKTYFDPILKHNKGKYMKFLLQLCKCGVVSFLSTSLVVCSVGIFFVPKKNGKLRLILDARRCNQYFRRPPTGNNTSLSCLSSLSNVRVDPKQKLYLSQYDVKDFFYRLKLPKGLCKYCGLPQLTLGEFRHISAQWIGFRRVFWQTLADFQMITPWLQFSKCFLWAFLGGAANVLGACPI